ncbi:MAG: carbohydrate binding family 9 domain-containing protein [Gemmatimonadetes bacterium]|nr:carbohydrate binding family 9 domain-containing protein [Gemmatimonadota bacterium]
MLIGLLFALQQAGAGVEVPRFEDEVRIDGVMDEDVWSRAAVLDNFTQYEPADGRPAAERTVVRVWYAPDAIYFGIHAYDSQPEAIRAKRANRDALGGDDRVTIFLDTFNDRRRAFFFAVNAFGVQQDGVRTEGAASAGRTFGGNTDTSPDFLYESQGRLTNDGYVVEVRIPFKSLRYPSSQDMAWGINIERVTQRTGFVDTWPDVRRASASFLAQGGTLTGLRELRRGIVFEAQPTLTVNAPGARTASGFERGDMEPDIGVTARLGFTNISVDATVNPDFSQVEADAGQVTVNERFALFVTEKRPFFLEGIELFSTPNQLVYTRQIVNPSVGGKVTGKVGSLSIAHLTAIDEDIDGAGRDALFNVTRLRRDIGQSSLIGATFTDRSVLDSAAFNRVAALDTRLVFGRMYYVQTQVGGSWTQHGGETLAAPIWKVELDRTGRAFGFNYSVNGTGEDFESHAGFVNRSNIINAGLMNRLTWYGTSGAPIERITTFFGPSRLWRHSGGRAIEGSEFVNASLQFRGDWELSGRAGRNFVELDPDAYTSYQTGSPAAPLAYTPLDDVSGPSFELSGSTPTFRRFDASASAGAGRVTIFAEGSAGDSRAARAAVALRPTSAVRVELSTSYLHIRRERDGSEFARTLLPRARVEFQPTRAFFLRGIAEYRAERRDALRDARTGDPLVIGGVPVAGFRTNGVSVELLASYQPTPGTVAFLGYAAALTGTDPFAFDRLSRSRDGLFLKLAYLLRR